MMNASVQQWLVPLRSPGRGTGHAAAAAAVPSADGGGTSEPTALLLFPWAGSGPSAFSKWSSLFKASGGVECWVVSMPGRERRIHETPTSDLRAIVRAIVSEAADKGILARRWAVFGHSMGALLAYETARWASLLAETGEPEGLAHAPTRDASAVAPIQPPLCVLVSGMRAPMLPWKGPCVCDGTRAELVAMLRGLGGTPDELLTNDEFMSFVEPVMRADYRIVEKYRETRAPAAHAGEAVVGAATATATAIGGAGAGDTTGSVAAAAEASEAEPRLSCRLVVLNGDKDERRWERWVEVTSGATTVLEFAGDHFYFADAAVLEKVVAAVCHELRSAVADASAACGLDDDAASARSTGTASSTDLDESAPELAGAGRDADHCGGAVKPRPAGHPASAIAEGASAGAALHFGDDAAGEGGIHHGGPDGAVQSGAERLVVGCVAAGDDSAGPAATA